MALLLLLFLGINTHNLSQAASNSNSLIAFNRIAENKQAVMDYVEPISALLKWRTKRLATTSTSSVTHVFSQYTPDMIKLNEHLSGAVSGYSAILSTAYIDELLHHARSRTISIHDMRRELARSTLCLAERIEWIGGDTSEDISITAEKSLGKHCIYFGTPLREYKALVMTQLLYAVCFPEKTLTHTCVFDCLEALGFMPKTEPLAATDAAADNLTTDEPLYCEPYQFVAKDFYDLAIEELIFIKSNLSYLPPIQTDGIAGLSYCYALLTQFHVEQKEHPGEPAEEKKSFCFDNQLAKILLLLGHHYPRYRDNGINVPSYVNIIRWRFNLFTGIEPRQNHFA